MSNKTIANFSAFVILFALAGTFFSSCSDFSSNGGKVASESTYHPPAVVGTIRSSQITESSGIAASKCQKKILWTHNDSGDDAFVFAINPAGDDLGTWKLPNARNIDWEDIATVKDNSGKCFMFIGEIGDNGQKRAEHAIYRFREPEVSDSSRNSSRKDPLLTENAEILRFRYPDYNQDAETLMIQPKTGDIYVITKRVNGPAGVYRIKPEFGGIAVQTAAKVAEIAVPSLPNGLLTSGDISPDGRHVIICDYSNGYELALPEDAENFDDIWKQKPELVDLGQRAVGEAVCYSVDGMSVFATSERRNSPVIEVKRSK